MVCKSLFWNLWKIFPHFFWSKILCWQSVSLISPEQGMVAAPRGHCPQFPTGLDQHTTWLNGVSECQQLWKWWLANLVVTLLHCRYMGKCPGPWLWDCGACKPGQVKVCSVPHCLCFPQVPIKPRHCGWAICVEEWEGGFFASIITSLPLKTPSIHALSQTYYCPVLSSKIFSSYTFGQTSCFLFMSSKNGFELWPLIQVWMD